MPSPRVCHSGGSPGADEAWKEGCLAHGVGVRDYRPFDDPQPENPSSVVLTATQLRQADPLLSEAAHHLGKDLQGLSERDLNYIRRNYWQAKEAQAVYAVGRIQRREQTGALCDSVSGGTAWAVLMAGGLGKPVYVFDDEAGCRQCSQRWHVFDFANGCMVPLPEDHALLPPLLPEQFAGIGTRSLGAAGAAAIWRLCAASLGAKLP
ncbi:hypothetical protein ABPG77_000311 [Micractinium sp. CCAP 211/92]